MVQVSAGYDAHRLDPMEKLNYQSATYHALVSSLMSLADELCSKSSCQACMQFHRSDAVLADTKQAVQGCIAENHLHMQPGHP